jgi:hypothetical protein
MAKNANDADVSCPRCGGGWFSEQQFSEYASGAYSQRVGGALHSLGQAQPAYVCLCGYPRAARVPHKLVPDSQKFNAAVECARQFVEVEGFLEQGFAELANTTVTLTEIDTLRRRIARLELELARLAQQKAQP